MYGKSAVLFMFPYSERGYNMDSRSESATWAHILPKKVFFPENVRKWVCIALNIMDRAKGGEAEQVKRE